MRNFICFILSVAMILVSCSKKDTHSNLRNCREVEYSAEIEIGLSNEICFPDGNSLTLIEVVHALCPCEANCEWEGGLYINLQTETSENTLEKNFYSNRLDQDRSIFDGYEISTFVYSYNSEDGEVPLCIEDFDPAKTTLHFTISKIL